ncbi:hypothetical protein PVIIG_02473 [Plasmodium vivax India VII]|uniref:Programmed cell death protein 2 C-terminal domain-containing protein n=1 Tax=Plasmodium vivax India VII TaxID=1077284 RepID=A0A0J9V9F0_PLAVI|nr:hypothetical protein PVIIG_02473 [Plasmodium vivax India VII]
MGHVLLGYTKERERKNELHDKQSVRKKFVSKVGGRPFWLDRINLLPQKEFHCFLCSKLMSFLLQVYAPLDDMPHCFHRCLYLFICLSCGNQVKCFRTQLPRSNPFYGYSLAGGGGDEAESDEEESGGVEGGGDDGEEADNEEEDDDGEEEETGEEPSGEETPSEVATTERSNGATTTGEPNGPAAPLNCNSHPSSARKGNAKGINRDADYLTLLMQKDKNKFDEQMEYLFCCRICGIPCEEKRGRHRECSERRHVIFREKKIYISDEEDCVSSSSESWSSSGGGQGEEQSDGQGEQLNGQEEQEGEEEQLDGQPDAQPDGQLDGKREGGDLDRSEMNAFEQIQREVLGRRSIDRVFLSYCSKLRRFPRQFIRYSYKGEALLSSSEATNSNQNNVFDESLRVTFCSGRSPKKQLSSPGGGNPNGIVPPQCHICKRKKVFEFQVLSTVINYLEVKKNVMTTEDPLSNLKFTHISVYTCERNCDAYDVNNVQGRQGRADTSRYIQEYASVQAE